MEQEDTLSFEAMTLFSQTQTHGLSVSHTLTDVRRKISQGRRRQRRKGGREGRRILGRTDGEAVCAALIRLWGQRRKEWREA